MLSSGVAVTRVSALPSEASFAAKGYPGLPYGRQRRNMLDKDEFTTTAIYRIAWQELGSFSQTTLEST